jgi:hypothetical protein
MFSRIDKIINGFSWDQKKENSDSKLQTNKNEDIILNY